MAGYIGSKANVSQIDGYVKSEVDTLLGQELNLSGGSMTGHLNFGDNIKIQSGAGTDLQIYHDASHSYIKDAGTGNLRLSATAIELMKVDTSELMASFAQDGAVTLYYDNAVKLATASGGITVTGEVAATSLDISGDIDVDGTTNLDVVDIDGAVDMASTLGVTGVVTANAGVVVDNITIDGTEIDLSSGDLTLDVAGNILLNADGGGVYFQDASLLVGSLQNSSSDFLISAEIADKDIIFRGIDGSSTIDALKLDMSAGGNAIFTGNIIGSDELQLLQPNGTNNFGMELNNSHQVKYKARGSSGTHIFTNTTSDTERMRIDSSGNVGIGGSPVSTDAAYDGASLHLRQEASSKGSQIHFTNAATGDAAGNGAHISMWHDDDLYITNQESDGQIKFASGGNSDALVIDSSGNTTFAGDVIMGSNQIVFNNNSQAIQIKDAAGTASYVLYQDNADTLILGNGTNVEKIRLDTSGHEGALVIDSAGTLFLGTTTPALHSSMTGIVFDNGSLLNDASRGASKSVTLAQNLAIDSGNTWAYLSTDEGSYYQQFNGNHYFGTAPSGSAGANATVTSKLTILNDGYISMAGASDVRLTLGSQGTEGNNDANWVRGNGTSLSYNAASANHIWEIGGAEKMRIDSSGNVGIGLSSNIDRKLHVENDNDYAAKFGGTGGGDYAIEIGQTGTNGSAGLNATGSGGSMKFSIAGSEKARIAPDGQFGILQSSPQSYNSGADDLVVGNGGSAGITVVSGTSNSGNLFFADGTSGNQAYRGYVQYQHSDDRLVLGAAGDDRVWIYDGNVAIGHQDAWHKLQITGDGTENTSIFLHNDSDTDGHYNGIIFKSDSTNTNVRKKAGIFFERTAIRGQGTLHFCVEASNDDSNVSLSHSQLQMNGDKVSINGAGSDLFYINGKATATAMGIKIGTNGYNAIEFDNATGSLVGRITPGASSTAYHTSSDYRLKENVVDMTGATARLKQLKPKRFNWIVDSTNTLIDGFLAHEVSSIVPEAVVGEKDAVHPEGHHEAGEIDPQGIDHSKLVPLLVKTIQELEARLTAGGL